MSDKIVRGRFAPSPSGRMHLGNVYAAVMSYVAAKSVGGEWIVRIEDLDRQRCKSEFCDMLLEDLEWLGLHSDGEIVYQSQRDEIYENALRQLEAKNLTYSCFCTRADIMAASAPHESDGAVVYGGKCRHLTMAERAALGTVRKPSTRLIVPDEIVVFRDMNYGEQRCNLLTDCGDFIIRRGDGNFAYQLAVSVDDAMQGITQIVRGRDLLSSTHQQIYLRRLLGYEVPDFLHLPLLVAADGRRLAKRDMTADMSHLRERFSPEELIGKVMHICHQTECAEPMSACDAAKLFDVGKIGVADCKIFS
ncbi:MAG: tRNA glutamyl-Q(34) synthetase GluQRS [Bacteroidales bacterium]|nr:tRNA glutamyl-Q(34) synthetase GluQRS [Bacteroidales bacterium]